VSGAATRAKELSQQPDVKKALARDRDLDAAESRMLADIVELEASLGDDERRATALMTLRSRLSALAKKAAEEEESPARSQARRVLRAITSGAAGRVQDREYRALLEQLAPRGR
jgi:hypothetical protein